MVNKWMFLVVKVTVIMIEFGFVFAFGALYLVLLEKYKVDRSATAAVQSILTGVTLSFGIGASLAFFSCVVVIDRIYTGKQKLIALAFTNSATSVGGLVYPHFFDLLIRNYGLNGTFLIQGGLFCHCFPLFLLCWINRSFLNISNSLPKDSTEENTPTRSLRPQELAVQQAQDTLVDARQIN